MSWSYFYSKFLLWRAILSDLLCRKHHEAKQAPGWRLEQSRPGILTWTTPGGRSYTTKPIVYPG